MLSSLAVFAMLAVACLVCYHFGKFAGQRQEARWWTAMLCAAGSHKLDLLRALLAAQDPKKEVGPDCPEELVPHIAVPYTGDGGKPIVLPPRWAEDVPDETLQQITKSFDRIDNAMQAAARQMAAAEAALADIKRPLA